MDSRRRADEQSPDAALDFVRFCYRRRRVGWPELYDEMCAVASRGLYHGWTFTDLAERGIAFSLSEMPRLAAMAARVGQEDGDRRSRVLAGVMSRVGTGQADGPDHSSPPEEVAGRVLVGAAQ